MADGNIELTVGANTKPAESSLKKFMQAVGNTFKHTDVETLNKKLQETNVAIKEAEKNVKKYNSTLEKAKAGKIVSESQRELQQAIKDNAKEIQNAQKEYDKMFNTKEGKEYTARYKRYEAEIEAARKAETKIQDLISGKAELASVTNAKNIIAESKTEVEKLNLTQEKVLAAQEKYEQSVARVQDLWAKARNSAGMSPTGYYNDEGKFISNSVSIEKDHTGNERYISKDQLAEIRRAEASMRASAVYAENISQAYTEIAAKVQTAEKYLQDTDNGKNLNATSEMQEAKEALKEADFYVQKYENDIREISKPFDDAARNIRRLEAESASLQTALEVSKENFVRQVEEDAQKATTELETTTAQAQALRDELEDEGDGGNGGGKPGLFGKMFNSMRQLDHMFKRMTTRLLFYNTFGKTIRAFTEYLGRAVRADSNLVYSLGALKAAFATTFQYIWSVVGPILGKIIAIILNLVNAINRLLGLITGRSLKDMQKGAKALAGYGTAAKGATKEIKKTLAAFDELIQIGDKDEDAGGGGAGGGEGIPLNWDDNLLKGKLSELDIYVAGAMLAVGAILTFTGANVPLGLGLMAAGAAVIASALAEDWDTMPRNIKSAITKVLIVLGIGALVIGAILAFSGANIPLGIGLMIAGAAALGTAAKLNWDSIERALQGPLGVILSLLLTALLVIGAILTFSGAHPVIGIGLMIAGAAGLAAMVNLNWDSMSETLRGPLLVVLGMLATYMVIVGMVLAMSGASLPLGIGLIAAGAIILGKAVAPRWDTIKKSLQGPLGEVMTLIGTFLIVIGVVLLFSGAGISLGLGILVAGGATLAAPIAANWDLIKEKIKGAWESIKQYWDAHIKPVFTKAWWKDKFDSIYQGLKDRLNAIIEIAERAANSIIDKLNSMSFDVPDWVIGIGGKHFGFNIPRATIPRLAQGAVIPPNREFMALLGDQKHGTNIETPLDTMIQAFTEALDNRGTQTVNIKFEGNLAQLARVLKPYLDDDDVRQGTRRSNGLIVGGSY